jgi:hypothetical protein
MIDLPDVLTTKQREARKVLTGGAMHALLEGGSRSGKTFLICREIARRALYAPKSRHAAFRFRFNHIKTAIILDTWPKMMSLCYPKIPYDVNKTDWFAEFTNGSQVWFGGLDDKERTDKILGQEYVTLFFNEVSQIPFESRETALSRLAQRVEQQVQVEETGETVSTLMRPRAWADLNPTNKGHWAYRLFHSKLDPSSGRTLAQPDNYAFFRLNPEDNVQNLSPEYLQVLEQMSAAKRMRFMRGEWADENPNALFSDTDIEKWRVLDGVVPPMVKIVVGIDPSGSGDEDNADNDEIGITVGGLGVDGNAYLLEDCSVKAGPATWGRIATSAYERHEANVIVGEGNFGGDMVRHVVQTVPGHQRTPFKKVTASRGKAVRAEPFSALYPVGKVRHVGVFPKLEEELCAMSTIGYVGLGSPNRADAWIWVLAELFPGLIRQKPEKEKEKQHGLPHHAGGTGWMMG